MNAETKSGFGRGGPTQAGVTPRPAQTLTARVGRWLAWGARLVTVAVVWALSMAVLVPVLAGAFVIGAAVLFVLGLAAIPIAIAARIAP